MCMHGPMHGPIERDHLSSGAAAITASSLPLRELNVDFLQKGEQREPDGSVFIGHLYQCEQQRVPQSRRRRLRRGGDGGNPASGVRLRSSGRFAEAMQHDPAADAGPDPVRTCREARCSWRLFNWASDAADFSDADMEVLWHGLTERKILAMVTSSRTAASPSC